MTKAQFQAVEAVMLQGMQRSVHDTGHIYRVLYAALRIAKTEPDADADIVILAALLHDIGRAAKSENPKVGHAELGAGMAHSILLEQGFGEAAAAHVRDCVRTHSYKEGLAPASLEAKILFDADKLDLTGAVGCARALLFGAEIDEPLYRVGKDGLPTKGKPGEAPSLYREYTRKLKDLHKRFYTKEAKKIAKKRQEAMDAWFASLKKEINGGYKKGTALLEDALTD